MIAFQLELITGTFVLVIPCLPGLLGVTCNWYACNTNYIFTSMPFLLVTDTPRNFIATRAGLDTAYTSWTAPASNIPSIERYEVFYESDYDVRTSGGNTTAPQVSLILDLLDEDVTYTAYVVAYGGDLRSNPSNTATILTSKTLHRQPPNVHCKNRFVKLTKKFVPVMHRI